MSSSSSIPRRFSAASSSSTPAAAPTTAFKNGSINTAKETSKHAVAADPPKHTTAHTHSRRQSLVDAPKPPISAEKLIDTLLAAKRSLASVANAVHATATAAEASDLLEAAVLASAQTVFVAGGVKGQIKMLRQFRDSVLQTLELTGAEFRSLIAVMDQSAAQLRERLDVLGNTPVHKELRPKGEMPSTLRDFAEEKNVESIEHNLKTTLDDMQNARSIFQNECDRLIADIQALEFQLGVRTKPNATEKEKEPLSSSKALVAELSQQQIKIQNNLEEIATSLQSLTKHFDHCLIAVKSIPGAMALAREHAPEVLLSEHDHLDQMKPVTPEEVIQLVNVVLQDALLVDDISAQINDQTRLIEQTLDQMHKGLDDVKASYMRALEAFALLKEAGAKMPGLVEAECVFTDQWALEKQNVRENLHFMDSLSTAYDNYFRTYHALLIEADRRRQVEQRVAAVWAKAKDQVDRLVQLDRVEAERFRAEHGDSLPGDLWPGMDVALPVYEVVVAAADHEAAAMPQLPVDVVEAAHQLLNGGARGAKGKGMAGKERYA